MRRLDILLIGQSQALTDLALELEQHGHSLARLANLVELPPSTFDLLIDDASLPFRDFGDAPRLMLQLGIGVPCASGLPALDGSRAATPGAGLPRQPESGAGPGARRSAHRRKRNQGMVGFQ